MYDDRLRQLDEEFLMGTRAELERAHEKFPDDETDKDNEDWLSVLVEEVGEVAKALNECEGPERVRAELTQVAAMASRFATSMIVRPT